jgi:hypothetical protein
MESAFRQLKDLNLQTELLEAFGWDEEERDRFNIWFIDSLNVGSSPEMLFNEIKNSFGEEVLNIIKKIIKSEIDNIEDDKIKEGNIYEA